MYIGKGNDPPQSKSQMIECTVLYDGRSKVPNYRPRGRAANRIAKLRRTGLCGGDVPIDLLLHGP